MSSSSLSRLPIHTLKLILYEARVHLPTDILEKGELVARVSTWLEEERTAAEDRDKQEEWERQEREEQERKGQPWRWNMKILDQEANIAIVDCGHLSMCRACSELVLASSRECPLCRTRIVTEARLLRIFKM
ncbi:hypothetical protein DFH29DRAFT_321845 [Suillus ampliporus]|nr:hypothetical protein DFH29DRAFT_321845 [Suillus ampliporus]